MPDFDEVVRSRRTIRGFLRDRPVPEAVLREALALAQRSPSNCNVQPWRVQVASGAARDRVVRGMLERFDQGDLGDPEDPIDAFPGEYRKLQVACAVELYGSLGVARDDGPGRLAALRQNYELFDAPHVAFVSMGRHFGLGVALDVGVWLQSFVLALWSRGVGCCPQASLRYYPEVVRRELGLPGDQRLLCGISIGYEDPAAPANACRQRREALETNVRFHE